MRPIGEPCQWKACQPGLIIYRGKYIAMCSEYRLPNGLPQAIIEASGEFLHLKPDEFVQPYEVVEAK